jgi:hypothetical protein
VKNPKAISVIAPNSVWAVGDRDAGAAKVHPATEHWNGLKWKLIDAPYEGLGESNLNGVSGLAKDDVWAVGYWQPVKKTDAAFHTLTEHWDGIVWSVVPSPTVGTQSNTLTAVSAVSPNDVWAVGYYFQGATRTRSTLTEHWDGSAWSVVPGVDPGSASNSLLAVGAVSAGDVWAVGFTNDGQGYQTLAEHWDGSSWSVVPTAADPGSPEGVLSAVSENGPNDVWAFGYHVLNGKYRTLVEHWDGSAWTIMPATTDGADKVVTVLRGGSSLGGQAWGVGFDYRQSDGRYKEFTEHFDGTSWTTFPGAMSTLDDKSEMYAVAHVPGTTRVWSAARSSHLEVICPAAGVQHSVAPTTRLWDRHRGYLTRPQQPGLIQGATNVALPARTAPAVAVTAQDVANSAGIYEETITHGAVVADYNGDHWPDIFLGRHLNVPKLYLNNHDGTFRLVDDDGEFKSGDTHGCTSADFNSDGLMDIFCNTGSDRGTEAKRDNLFLQQVDGTFQDQAGPYHVLQPFDRGRWSGAIDANDDGNPDVFTSNFPDRADGMPSTNRLAINEGTGTFAPAPSFGLDRELNGSSISVGDYNNDGFQDLMITGTAGLSLFRNDGGTGFTDVTASLGLTSKPDYARFVDFNRDGKLDIATVTTRTLRLYLQQGGSFVAGPKVSDLQSGFSLATDDTVDVNGDGWPDIYVMQAGTGSTENAPDLIYLNNGAGTGFDPSPITVPQPPTLGKADQATPIDYDRNGLTDFVVQNGNSTANGSIQLVAFFPA